MPPIIQKLLALKNPFRVFRVFRSSFYKFWYNRVGGCPLIEQPTSHTTVRTVRYTAVQ